MEKIVISLGGSLVVPDKIDVSFLRDFKNFLLEEIKHGRRFFIIVGGGQTCRNYQKAAQEVSKISNDDLDWLGICSCRLNALLVRAVFGDIAYPEIITDLGILTDKINNSIVVLGPNKPGSSSDLGAVQIAQNVGAKKVINLSNIDYVYDSDPKMNPNAKKFEEISWAEYRKLIPKEWNPGLNTPFDPIASEIAEKEGIEVIIMNGKPIDNLVKYLNGEKFFGTVIK